MDAPGKAGKPRIVVLASSRRTRLARRVAQLFELSIEDQRAARLAARHNAWRETSRDVSSEGPKGRNCNSPAQRAGLLDVTRLFSEGPRGRNVNNPAQRAVLGIRSASSPEEAK